SLRVLLESSKLVDLGIGKVIADFRVLAEVGKVAQIAHADVHTDGQADIQPIAVVLTGQQSLGVVIRINQRIIVVSRYELRSKLAKDNSKHSAEGLPFKAGSRRQDEL